MDQFEIIKSWIENADALVINAGAGIGVDSGLKDYRGDGGTWGKLENDTSKSVFELINPDIFIESPSFAWSMFADLMIEYKNTEPHDGFKILLKWIEKFNLEYFVLTSNIDGHFQKAGFSNDKVRELHGTLWKLQAIDPSLDNLIYENNLELENIKKDVLKNLYPKLPDSEILARPNVYLFRDGTYIDTYSKQQEERFESFLECNKEKNILVLEIGSGPHVQSIRMKTRMLSSKYDAKVVRINPKDSKIREPHQGVKKGALEALILIDDYIENR